MKKTVIVTQQNPGCLTQLLWFALIGWWAGQLWMAAAWFLMITIVGAPLGVAMMNRLPQVIALRGQTTGVEVTRIGNLEYVSRGHARAAAQHLVAGALLCADRLVAERDLDGGRLCGLPDDHWPAHRVLDV